MKEKQKTKKNDKKSGFNLPARPSRWRQRRAFRDDDDRSFDNGSLLQNADPMDFGFAASAGW